LKIKLILEKGSRWRKGDEVFSQHFVTMSEALNRSEIYVPTIEN